MRPIFDKNSPVAQTWKDAWESKESALRTRLYIQNEHLEKSTRDLAPLKVGDTCHVQNQTGNNPKKWDKTGKVVHIGDNDNYGVKMDGSGRLTHRNRRDLRKITPRVITPVRQTPEAPKTPNIPAGPTGKAPVEGPPTTGPIESVPGQDQDPPGLERRPPTWETPVRAPQNPAIPQHRQSPERRRLHWTDQEQENQTELVHQNQDYPPVATPPTTPQPYMASPARTPQTWTPPGPVPPSQVPVQVMLYCLGC